MIDSPAEGSDVRRHTNPRRKLTGSAGRPTNRKGSFSRKKHARCAATNVQKTKRRRSEKKTTSEYPMTSERAAKAASNCRATLRLTPRSFGSLGEGFRNRFFSRSADARRAISLRTPDGRPPRPVRAPARDSTTKSSRIRRRRRRARAPRSRYRPRTRSRSIRAPAGSRLRHGSAHSRVGGVAPDAASAAESTSVNDTRSVSSLATRSMRAASASASHGGWAAAQGEVVWWVCPG